MSKKLKDVDESSMTAGVHGVHMPLGSKSKKKNNPSKPFGEASLDERIEKRGDQWVVIDPRTGAERGTAASRDKARELQTQLGITVKRDPSKLTDPSKKRKNDKPVKFKKPKHKVSTEVKEAFRLLKKSGFDLVNEGSMITYMFDEDKKPVWENFLGSLSKKIVLSDKGLSEVLQFMAKAEAKVLAKSVMEIKKVLESSGKFMVERLTADQDPDTGDVRMPFKVSMHEGKSLVFGVKLENNKPMILFPEESRNILNNLFTTESKLLRAELMHVQETALDKINDMLEASLRRDAYLTELQNKLNELLGSMSLVEVSMLKNLVRERLKGVK